MTTALHSWAAMPPPPKPDPQIIPGSVLPNFTPVNPENPQSEKANHSVQSRIRLNAFEKLQLARMCVQYGEEYSQRGGRERFWTKIQSLLSGQIGRQIGNPRSIMTRMLADYEANLRSGIAGSGAAHGDWGFGHTMAQWKTRVDLVGHNLHHFAISISLEFSF